MLTIERDGYCHTCKKDQKWYLVHAMDTFTEKVIPCWECGTCGKFVPVDAFPGYLRTGNVVIKRTIKPKKGKK